MMASFGKPICLIFLVCAVICCVSIADNVCNAFKTTFFKSIIPRSADNEQLSVLAVAHSPIFDVTRSAFPLYISGTACLHGKYKKQKSTFQLIV